MEPNDAIDNLLEGYFSSERVTSAVSKIKNIQALQSAAHMQQTEANTVYRFIADSINQTHIDLDEVAQIIDLNRNEINYIMTESRPEPLWIAPNSMARILLAFNLHVDNMKKLIINTFKVKKESGSEQKTMARSSSRTGDTARNRQMQDGINAVLFQISINHQENIVSATALSDDDQSRINAYVNKVIAELTALDAEYLFS